MPFIDSTTALAHLPMGPPIGKAHYFPCILGYLQCGSILLVAPFAPLATTPGAPTTWLLIVVLPVPYTLQLPKIIVCLVDIAATLSCTLPLAVGPNVLLQLIDTLPQGVGQHTHHSTYTHTMWALCYTHVTLCKFSMVATTYNLSWVSHPMPHSTHTTGSHHGPNP